MSNTLSISEVFVCVLGKVLMFTLPYGTCTLKTTLRKKRRTKIKVSKIHQKFLMMREIVKNKIIIFFKFIIKISLNYHFKTTENICILLFHHNAFKILKSLIFHI